MEDTLLFLDTPPPPPHGLRPGRDSDSPALPIRWSWELVVLPRSPRRDTSHLQAPGCPGLLLTRDAVNLLGADGTPALRQPSVHRCLPRLGGGRRDPRTSHGPALSVGASGERHLAASVCCTQAPALTSPDGPLLGSSCFRTWACTPGRWAGRPTRVGGTGLRSRCWVCWGRALPFLRPPPGGVPAFCSHLCFPGVRSSRPSWAPADASGGPGALLPPSRSGELVRGSPRQLGGYGAPGAENRRRIS